MPASENRRYYISRMLFRLYGSLGVFASEGDYIDALKAHHAVMQAAMKAKQTVDISHCDTLDHLVLDCCKMYQKDSSL